MKILVLCEHGNNRSVTIAHHLKYWDHDVLPAGLEKNSPETLNMLYNWADRIIVTDGDQHQRLLGNPKVQLWDVGPDTYPRPFNRELLAKVRKLMDENRAEYKPS